MSAMTPLFDAIFGLEGFEKTAFWLGVFIAFLGAGFFVDYLMHKQGFRRFLECCLRLYSRLRRSLCQVQLFSETALLGV